MVIIIMTYATEKLVMESAGSLPPVSKLMACCCEFFLENDLRQQPPMCR